MMRKLSDFRFFKFGNDKIGEDSKIKILTTMADYQIIFHEDKENIRKKLKSYGYKYDNLPEMFGAEFQF